MVESFLNFKRTFLEQFKSELKEDAFWGNSPPPQELAIFASENPYIKLYSSVILTKNK